MFYVYLLIDPETNLPFYVGKGKGDRAKTHLRSSNLKENTLKSTKIKSLLSKNLEPKIMFIGESLTEAQAWELEVAKIAEYGRKDLGTGILCNHTDGGEGPSNRIPWNKGKKFSDESRKKMSVSWHLSSLSKKAAVENSKKAAKKNSGRKRPTHSKFMKENNLNKLKVLSEKPLLWVNKKTGKQVYGTRYDVLEADPSVKIHELGVAMTGKYAHRGWIPSIFL